MERDGSEDVQGHSMSMLESGSNYSDGSSRPAAGPKPGAVADTLYTTAEIAVWLCISAAVLEKARSTGLGDFPPTSASAGVSDTVMPMLLRGSWRTASISTARRCFRTRCKLKKIEPDGSGSSNSYGAGGRCAAAMRAAT